MSQPVSVPNFIQGVSQQGRFQIRGTQQLDQQNCMNSPADGCYARPGAELVSVPYRQLAAVTGKNYYAEFRRGTEDYLLEVFPTGQFFIYNLSTGTIVNNVGTWAGTAYLASANPRDDIQMQMVGDFLFLLNRTKTVSMRTDAPSKSPKRPFEGVVFVRGGAYSARYTVSITYAGNVYEYSYDTPDNSVAANANYINTDHIASTLFRAMTGGSTAVTKYKTGGTLYPDVLGGQGQNYQGAVGPVVGVTDLTTLGFNLHINGHAIHIWHDTVDFKLDADAGALSGTNLIAFEDSIVSFARLPNNGFENYVTKVLGTSTSQSDDFYVKCSQTGSSATWVETVKPDIQTTLDESTLPVTVRIDALNTFTPVMPTWGKRVVGDTVSDPDPLFVGQRIEDMMFNDGRLAMLTEDSVSWSKAENPYTFFRSSVQTILDNDPVAFLVNGSSNTAVVKRGFVVGGQAEIWAQGQQFAVRSQDNQFATKNVSIKQSTSYDFVPQANPGMAGQSFLFASDEDSVNGEKAYAILRDLLYQNGRIAGETDITAHVPHFIPSDVRTITVSDTKKMAVVFCPSTPTTLYVYNFFVEGEERTQSAWQTWTFDGVVDRILWAGFFKTQLRLLVSSKGTYFDGAVYETSRNCYKFLRMVLSSEYYDPGSEYHTRLDIRANESGFTFVSYDGVANETTIRVPNAFIKDGSLQDLLFVQRSGASRGKVFKAIRAGTVGVFDVVVYGDLRGALTNTLIPFYAGWPIVSFTQPSLPVTKDQSGETVLHDEMTIKTLRVACKGTVFFEAVVTQSNGQENRYPFGEPSVLGSVKRKSGVLKIPVRERDSADFSLKLVNPTPFPSAWQFGQWAVETVVHED
jgi:hypothetical protein